MINERVSFEMLGMSEKTTLTGLSMFMGMASSTVCPEDHVEIRCRNWVDLSEG